MILHICPHCNASSFYPADLQGTVHCHSCGRPFDLSAFTRTEKATWVRFTQALPPFAKRVVGSRVARYGVLSVVGVVALWLVTSWVGVIPDAARLVNRRTVSLKKWDTVVEAIVLVAAGAPKSGGGIEFLAAGSGFVISNDGFIVTTAHLEPVPRLPSGARLASADLWYASLIEQDLASRAFVFRDHSFYLADLPADLRRQVFRIVATSKPGLVGEDLSLRTWVFLNGRRYDAEVVLADSVSGFAVLKIDGDARYRFVLPKTGAAGLLNKEVSALGFQALPPDLRTVSITGAMIAATRGAISRTFKDDAGTEFIEHTAAIEPYNNGGPLLVGETAVGINSGGVPGIYRAISTAPYATKIETTLREWREKKRSK